MKILRTKLRRDLLQEKVRFFAVTLLLSLGLMGFIGAWTAYRGLDASYEKTYEVLEYNDFIITVDGAPDTVTAELERISGVMAVEARISLDTAATMPDGNEIKAHIITVPDDRQPAVNSLFMESGEYFTPVGSVRGSEVQAIAEQHLSDYYKLVPGDRISIETPGRELQASLQGTAASAECLMVTTGTTELIATPQNYGVLFLPKSTIETAFGMGGTSTEFVFTVTDSQGVDEAMNAASSLLSERCQVLSAMTGTELPGKTLLKVDLDSIRDVSIYFPICFLVVTVLSLFMIITRMIFAQRKYIGAMMAAGVRTAKIVKHYLSYSLFVGVAGSVLGIIGGFIFGILFTHMYSEALGIPMVEVFIDWPFVAFGVVVSIASCIIAGYFPVWRLSRIYPAEVLVGEDVHSFDTSHHTITERIFPFVKRLPMLKLMPIRNLGRNRRRTFFSVVGLMLSLALMLIAFSFLDSMNHLLEYHFDEFMGYDADVVWSDPLITTSDTVEGLEMLDTVATAEPRTQLPCRFFKEDKPLSQGALEALSDDGRLLKVADLDGDEVPLPPDGALAAQWFHDSLGVKVGDLLTVETALGNREIPVRGFARQYSGLSLLISYDYAMELAEPEMREYGVAAIPITNALVKAKDGKSVDELRQELQSVDGVSTVTITKYAKDEIRENYLSVISLFLAIMLAFAIAMAVIVIYNTISIAFLERRREISTMLAIGTDVGLISRSMAVENFSMLIAATPLGLIFGYLLADSMVTAWNSQYFIWPTTIKGVSWAASLVLIFVVTFLAQLPDHRKADRMDVVNAIRERTG